MRGAVAGEVRRIDRLGQVAQVHRHDRDQVVLHLAVLCRTKRRQVAVGAQPEACAQERARGCSQRDVEAQRGRLTAGHGLGDRLAWAGEEAVAVPVDEPEEHCGLARGVHHRHRHRSRRPGHKARVTAYDHWECHAVLVVRRAPALSSPVAAALGWPLVSVSSAGPMRNPGTITCDGPLSVQGCCSQARRYDPTVRQITPVVVDEAEVDRQVGVDTVGIIGRFAAQTQSHRRWSRLSVADGGAVDAVVVCCPRRRWRFGSLRLRCSRRFRSGPPVWKFLRILTTR